jgi:cardiolipin synthase A/B
LRLDFRMIAAAAIPAGLTEVVWSRHSPAAQGVDRLGRKLVGSATVCGSCFQLFSDTQAMLKAIARDVDAAKTSVLMEF